MCACQVLIYRHSEAAFGADNLDGDFAPGCSVVPKVQGANMHDVTHTSENTRIYDTRASAELAVL